MRTTLIVLALSGAAAAFCGETVGSAPRTCAVPLLEAPIPKDTHFAMKVLPGNQRSIDSAIAIAPPAPACGSEDALTASAAPLFQRHWPGMFPPGFMNAPSVLGQKPFIGPSARGKDAGSK